MKKWVLVLLGAVLLLAGCNRNEPIDEHSQGIWNHYFVYPMSKLLLTLGHWFGDNPLSASKQAGDLLSCLLSILLWYNGRKAQQDVGG